MSLGFYRFGDENAGKVLKGLAHTAGLERPVIVRGVNNAATAVEPRLLEGTLPSGKRYFIFFGFNHTDTPIEPEFQINLPAGSHLAQDVTTRAVVLS